MIPLAPPLPRAPPTSLGVLGGSPSLANCPLGLPSPPKKLGGLGAARRLRGWRSGSQGQPSDPGQVPSPQQPEMAGAQERCIPFTPHFELHSLSPHE